MKSLTCALLAVVVCAHADTYPRQNGVDAQHYIFRLTLSDDTDEIAGEATADLRFVQDGIREVSLDLAAKMAVTEVLCAGAPVRFTHDTDRLVMAVPSPPAAGELRRFTVRYHGVPASGLYASKNRFGERVIFSINWPNLAHQWLPIIDHPYDKATSEFVVTAPAKYQVVANGLLQEETDLNDGRRLTHWKQSVPIASWLNAIGVAQFASRHFGTVHGIPLQTWVFHQDRENGIVTFETPTRQAMAFYIDHIGPYAYEKLADVEAAAPGFGGGTEHASAIFYGQNSVNDRPATGLVYHEIAHQWFGDSVTEKDWDDVWLSEGFATYFTLLTTEHYDGRDAFVAGLKRSRDNIFNLEKRLPGVAVVHNNLSDMTKVLNQIVYQKGGWTLHMLRAEIGDSKFWTGIRDYYQRYRDRNASSADFRKVMEEDSGADLGWFFQQWLYRPGSPVVEGGWRYLAESKQLEVELAQTQDGDAYRLPVEISIGGARVERLDFHQKRQQFRIAADTEPSTVVLDPNTKVLMQAQFTKRP